MKYKQPSNECSTTGCKHKRRKNNRTCRSCHAEYMRKWRAGRVYVKREEASQ